MIISNFKYKGKRTWCIIISNCDKNIDLESDLKKHLQTNYAPESLFLLRPNNNSEYLFAKERIPKFKEIEIQELIYNSNGVVSYKKDEININKNLHDIILNTLFNDIFNKHDTVIKASHQSYFNVPSGKLATHFIRIANVFTDSEEINILSIFLLDYFKDNPEIIYCDTPSIFSVIYSCILMKNTNCQNYNPKVKSYSPYNVNRDDIENTGNSLFIISTSINGSLPSRLNNIGVDLNVNYLDDRNYFDSNYDKIIYTGAIDEFYNYEFGALEYRSLKFENEILPIKDFQGVCVVSYPEKKYKFTRIIEHKHFEFGQQDFTVITREFPQNWKMGVQAYYPFNDVKNQIIYEKYTQNNDNKYVFGGRLGSYKYLNMDQTIERALQLVKNLK